MPGFVRYSMIFFSYLAPFIILSANEINSNFLRYLPISVKRHTQSNILDSIAANGEATTS